MWGAAANMEFLLGEVQLPYGNSPLCDTLPEIEVVNGDIFKSDVIGIGSRSGINQGACILKCHMNKNIILNLGGLRKYGWIISNRYKVRTGMGGLKWRKDRLEGY